MCPDFVFFHGDDVDVKSSIVDPHGLYLSDALPKLRGLAVFAEAYGDDFHRIEAVAEVDKSLRALDLKRKAVREAVNATKDAAAPYSGPAAVAYV